MLPLPKFARKRWERNRCVRLPALERHAVEHLLAGGVHEAHEDGVGGGQPQRHARRRRLLLARRRLLLRRRGRRGRRRRRAARGSAPAPPRRVAPHDAEHVQRAQQRDHAEQHDQDRPDRPPPAPPPPLAAHPGPERRQVLRGGSLVALAVLLHQQPRIEVQVLRVRAQERLDERRPGKQVPLLVLECAQVLGPDLRRRLDLGHVDPAPHPRLSKRLTDLRHEAPERLAGRYVVVGTRAGSPDSAASTRGRSASVTSTWRGLEPS